MSEFSWIANEDVTSSKIGDELALLDPKSGQYFTLNQTGSVVWQHLDRPRSMQDIVQIITEKFDIDPSVCESDIKELITQLNDAGLIKKA